MPSKSLYQISTFPRKGTETPTLPDSRMFHRYYPRKGAKTFLMLLGPTDTMYHPRKGAKTITQPLFHRGCSYHPRKGAKTWSSARKYSQALYHPRKGAKTQQRVYYRYAISYHPRKGAKNSASKKMRSFSFANLNFLFSVGCPSMNGTIAAAVIFSLLRLLHSDKMCYNKANSKHLLQN